MKVVAKDAAPDSKVSYDAEKIPEDRMMTPDGFHGPSTPINVRRGSWVVTNKELRFWKAMSDKSFRELYRELTTKEAKPEKEPPKG